MIQFYTLAARQAAWDPAVTECTHIFSTYVVPDVLHFLAFLIGFYMFRIQESEGLHALIEKVYFGMLLFLGVLTEFLFQAVSFLSGKVL